MSCFMESGADSNSCVVSCGPFKTPRPWPESIDSSLLYKSKNTGLFMWGKEHNVLRKRCLCRTSKKAFACWDIKLSLWIILCVSIIMYMSSLTLKHKTVEFNVVKTWTGGFVLSTQTWLDCIIDSVPVVSHRRFKALCLSPIRFWSQK